MATKRRPLHTPPSTAKGPTFNFRQNLNDTAARSEAKGTRPTATPTSIREILTMVVLYVCKKSIFFDINLKVALYLGSLFIISLIGDFLPYPKTYFARSDNLFNVYFVKMGWAWTLLFSIPFLSMTSVVLCCGDHQRFLRNHLPRIGIATSFWFIWTKLFNVIESTYGRCNVKGFDSKSGCLKAGHFWNGFDISGHAFILIYSSLILIEEARPIIGWESIKDYLRNEEHNRSAGDSSQTSNPLKNLKDEDLRALKHFYTKYTPTIRLIFVGMTMLQLLWDIMLVCTMLYYHRMVEKIVSGAIAILTWYFTYRAWYPSASLLPDPAGKGLFNYQKDGGKADPIVPLRRRASLLQQASAASSNKEIPRFMGMPLYSARQQQQQAQADAASETIFASGNSSRLGNNFDMSSPGASRFFNSKFDQ